MLQQKSEYKAEKREEMQEISKPEIDVDYDETVVTESSNNIFVNTTFGLFVSLSHIISDDYDRQQCSIKSKIDKKLRRSKAISHKDRATRCTARFFVKFTDR